MARKMDARTIDIPKDILKKLYVDEHLTIRQIAEKLGYSVVPVWRSLKRHSIKITPLGGRYMYQEKGITRKELKHLYVDRQFTLLKIAQKYDCNRHTVVTALKHFEIPIRSQSEVNKLSAQKRVWADNGHGRNWQGGKTRRLGGYILLYEPNHPHAYSGGYVYEHIKVWEDTFGKRLPKGWHVHHLNGVTDDNRPENLQAMPQGAHIGWARPYKARIQQLEAELKELQQLQLIARG